VDAQTLLKQAFMVPEKSDGSKPSPKKLKPLLGKALYNFLYILKDVIVRAWTEAKGYEGPKAETGRFLKERLHLIESVGRRGVLMAYLAFVGHCGDASHQYAFPEGEKGDTLVVFMLSTLAFVLRKVRVSCPLCFIMFCVGLW